MRKEEFYIGWQDEMPVGNRKFLQRLIAGISIATGLLILYVVLLQKPFNDHKFEFGILTELNGIYYEEPFPMLIVGEGVLDGFSKSVLLVGFGKLGVKDILQNIEATEGELSGHEITFEGSLIYGDGITLLELTNQEASFVSKSIIEEPIVPDERELSTFSYFGEIVDPKCYFGVMKPGQGKIHKSCAIRCLSGGIPPVLKVLPSYGLEYDYYLIKGENGEFVAQDLLPYVGSVIDFDGEVYMQNGWKVIQINPAEIKRNLATNDKLHSNGSTIASLMPNFSESGENFCIYPSR